MQYIAIVRNHASVTLVDILDDFIELTHILLSFKYYVNSVFWKNNF